MTQRRWQMTNNVNILSLQQKDENPIWATREVPAQFSVQRKAKVSWRLPTTTHHLFDANEHPFTKRPHLYMYTQMLAKQLAQCFWPCALDSLKNMFLCQAAAPRTQTENVSRSPAMTGVKQNYWVCIEAEKGRKPCMSLCRIIKLFQCSSSLLFIKSWIGNSVLSVKTETMMA